MCLHRTKFLNPDRNQDWDLDNLAPCNWVLKYQCTKYYDMKNIFAMNYLNHLRDIFLFTSPSLKMHCMAAWIPTPGSGQMASSLTSSESRSCPCNLRCQPLIVKKSFDFEAKFV